MKKEGKDMRRPFIVLAVITTLVFTGCPKRSDAKKAAELSYQFSGLVLDLVKATDRAATEGLISNETKAGLVPVLRKMNEGAKQFNALATELAAQAGQPQPEKLQALHLLLNTEILTPFLTVINLFTPLNIPYITSVINAIKIAILTISDRLSEFDVKVDTRRLEYA